MDTRRLMSADRISGWLKTLKERSPSTKLALLLTLTALIGGVATYAALNQMPPFGDNPDAVIWLLNFDLIILLLLVSLVARRIAKVWSGRRQGIAGSRLHVRLILVFSVLAATPAVIMTIFSAFFFHFGVQTWFSERVRAAVQNAQAVAEAYVEEHQQVIRADILAMANDLNRNALAFVDNKPALESFLETQSFLRNFSEVVVMTAEGRILASGGFTFTLAFENLIGSLPQGLIQQALEGDVVIMTGQTEDRVRALIQLNNIDNAFLFVGRIVDPTVLAHLENTRDASEQYALLQGKYSGLQVTVTMIFVVVALMLLLAAIWFGIVLARQLIAPISTLISTADRVRAGDLTARIPEQGDIEEFEFLAQSFNRMTAQIQDQRDELIRANRQMDERRRFTETVLAGVSSAIIGVDEKGDITIANLSANDLFGQDLDSGAVRNISTILPQVSPLLEQAHTRPDKITQGEIPYLSPDGDKRSLLVRIAIEQIGDMDKGAVLTFDDITELQSAQRKAAWADVARRIAHEIKNPLTPIQLSAERLKKKYLKEIKTEPDVFAQCTDTIVKHVDDIGRMVSEFSSFARMPDPILKLQDVRPHILDVLTLHRQAHPHITFTHEGLEESVVFPHVLCDAQQIRQALTNLFLNAIDSVSASERKGHLHLSVARIDNGDAMAVMLSDNGPGFPHGENLEQLTEPYVTHKEKGTGLGLAIVKKIMEDHNGRLILGTAEWLKARASSISLSGASVSLVLPIPGEGSAAQRPLRKKVKAA